MLNDQIAQGGQAYAGYYDMVRAPLLDLLAGVAVTDVLEIGCGAGATLAELRRRHAGCRTTGLELRPDAAARAREVAHEVVEADVLQWSPPDWSGRFDLIVLSHVLEHFEQPEAVLQRALSWLRPGGHLLVALPNIRHISVTVPLLLRGEFNYTPSGILDQTHLRFYTRKSAVRMLEGQGLRVLKLAPEFGGGKSKALRWLSLGLAEDLAAYAYNFLLARP